jgi:hypothetical protein
MAGDGSVGLRQRSKINVERKVSTSRYFKGELLIRRMQNRRSGGSKKMVMDSDSRCSYARSFGRCYVPYEYMLLCSKGTMLSFPGASLIIFILMEGI